MTIHASDRRTLLTVLGVCAMADLPYFVAFPLWLWPLWWAWMAAWMFAVCVIVHNQEHNPVFGHFLADRCFGLALAVTTGSAGIGGFVTHNIVHHRYRGRSPDWCSPELGGEGRGWWCSVRYLGLSFATIIGETLSGSAPALPKRFRLWLFLELTFSIAWAGLHLAWAPRLFITAFALPRVLAVAYLLLVNFYQHEGCDYDSEWNHSRNFTSHFLNWFLFNNGYHTAHHMNPAVHWTELETIHKTQVEGHIDSRFNEPSMFRYVLRFVTRQRLIARTTTSESKESFRPKPDSRP